MFSPPRANEVRVEAGGQKVGRLQPNAIVDGMHGRPSIIRTHMSRTSLNLLAARYQHVSMDPTDYPRSNSMTVSYSEGKRIFSCVRRMDIDQIYFNISLSRRAR